MSSERPDPPVPADADLRHLHGMMIDVTRLRHSEFIMTASKAGVGTAFLLWSAAWHEVPAGSLPQNERVLARLAYCDWDEWQTVRVEALNDYTLCSDGRYYHKTGSEVVKEALRYSRVASEKGRKGAHVRWHGHSTGNAQAMPEPSPGHSPANAQAMPADANGTEEKGLEGKGEEPEGAPRARDGRPRSGHRLGRPDHAGLRLQVP